MWWSPCTLFQIHRSLACFYLRSDMLQPQELGSCRVGSSFSLHPCPFPLPCSIARLLGHTCSHLECQLLDKIKAGGIKRYQNANKKTDGKQEQRCWLESSPTTCCILFECFRRRYQMCTRRMTVITTIPVAIERISIMSVFGVFFPWLCCASCVSTKKKESKLSRGKVIQFIWQPVLSLEVEHAEVII